MLSLQLENFSSCLAQISIFMQFKPICFCLNPCGHGKQLSRAAVYVLKMVTSQSSILFIFLLNKLQFLLFLVSFLPLYFFSLHKVLFPLFNIYRSSTASHFLSLFSLYFLLLFSTSTWLHLLFPKYFFPILLTIPALLCIMGTCGGLLQSMPGMCCLGMAGMHGSHLL